MPRKVDEHFECREKVRGIYECGAAVVFGIIALGTWAAERDRSHRFVKSCAEILDEYAPTFERLAEIDATACEHGIVEILFVSFCGLCARK